jgi:hypothetical protein
MRRVAPIAAVLLGAALLLGTPQALARPPLHWSRPAPILATSFTDFLLDVSCPSSSFCVALDKFSYVYTTRNPTAGAAATWQRHSPIDHEAVQAISCPTANLCVAVDQLGRAITSTNPTAGTDASWHQTLVDTARQLMDVSCASESLCVAVDQAGYAITSMNPGAAHAIWRRKRVPQLNTDFSGAAVDCPTTSLCVALGKTILTSTDPADGASARWAPTKARYRRSLITGDDIACHSSSLCVIVGYSDPGRAVKYHTVTSTNPGAAASASWKVGPGFTPVPLAHPVISCPSRSLCVALGNRTGQSKPATFTTTDPAAGARARWSANTRVAGVVVSCPTSRFCLVAGGRPAGVGFQVGTHAARATSTRAAPATPALQAAPLSVPWNPDATTVELVA